MGDIQSPKPVLGIAAVFSKHESAIQWALAKCQQHWGTLLAESPRFEFAETSYYEASMGDGIRKTFFAFAPPVDPGCLIERKLAANAWEDELAASGQYDEPRPVNIDPGTIALSKLVLASTKDYAHRIYLGEGIYAEITLHFRQGKWESHQWTFPDYKRDDYQAFFSRCRELLQQQYKLEGSS